MYFPVLLDGGPDRTPPKALSVFIVVTLKLKVAWRASQMLYAHSNGEANMSRSQYIGDLPLLLYAVEKTKQGPVTENSSTLVPEVGASLRR